MPIATPHRSLQYAALTAPLPSVVDALVNKYGIDPSRLVMEANGSDVQPYDVNNRNRIVLFTQPD